MAYYKSCWLGVGSSNQRELVPNSQTTCKGSVLTILVQMANSDESNPLLPNQEKVEMANDKKSGVGWTADGLPVSEPMMERSSTHWDSGLFSCLGRNGQFCSSDLEVCEFSCFSPFTSRLPY